MRSELDEAILLEGQQKAALDDQSHLAVTTICTADRTRQSAAQLAYDEEQQLISVSDTWSSTGCAKYASNLFPSDKDANFCVVVH